MCDDEIFIFRIFRKIIFLYFYISHNIFRIFMSYVFMFYLFKSIYISLKIGISLLKLGGQTHGDRICALNFELARFGMIF